MTRHHFRSIYQRENAIARRITRRKDRHSAHLKIKAERYDDIVPSKGTQGWMTH